MKAAPGLGLLQSRISTAARWLGPSVALSDASISAGLIWFVVQIGALRAGPAMFGLTMTAIAMIAAWQAASVACSGCAPRSSGAAVVGDEVAVGGQMLPGSYRAPAAVLAGAVGCAGVVDTRLAGAVIGAALAASVFVTGTLRPRSSRSAPKTRRAPVGEHAGPSAAGIVRAYLLIRAWMQVGVAAACLAVIARYSLGAAVVLVCAAAAYDAAAHLSAAGEPAGMRGPLAGVIAAAIAVLAFTGLSVPPFAPGDVVRFAAIAALTLPLGPAIARTNTAPATLDGRRGSWQRIAGEWAVRRLDSLSVSAVAWMWGLGLVSL